MRLANLLISLVIALTISGAAAGQNANKKPNLPTEFSCGRSHAGGAAYIPAKMILSDSGVEWMFLETFTRDVRVPWSSVTEWGCWGKIYGYGLEFAVSSPDDGGGSFKFFRSDLVKVNRIFEQHADGTAKAVPLQSRLE